MWSAKMQHREEWQPSTQIIIQASKCWNDPFDLEDSFHQNSRRPINNSWILGYSFWTTFYKVEPNISYLTSNIYSLKQIM